MLHRGASHGVHAAATASASICSTRLLGPRLLAPASRHKVRLVFGARQTGKTFLLSNLLPSSQTRIYNLQEPELRRRFEADPAAFGREVRALPRHVRNVVVDEIQKVPDLLDQIQALTILLRALGTSSSAAAATLRTYVGMYLEEEIRREAVV